METNDQMIEQLAQLVSQINVRDNLRKQNILEFPDALLVMEFDQLRSLIDEESNQLSIKEKVRRTITRYGAPIEVIAKLWELLQGWNLLQPIRRRIQRHHLLWALHKLKAYGSENDLIKGIACSQLYKKPDPKTFRKWTTTVIHALADLNDTVIKWENRKHGVPDDVDEFALTTPDGIDCEFQQIRIPDPNNPGKTKINKALFSKKLNGPGIRHEVTTALYSNHIVHVAGPFLPGEMNDLQIFRHELMHMLEDGERCYADKGYIGEAPEHIICDGMMGRVDLELQHRIEGRHETVNARLKIFNCLSKCYAGKLGTPQEKVEDHGRMFRAVVVVTQVAMDLGFRELYDITLMP